MWVGVVVVVVWVAGDIVLCAVLALYKSDRHDDDDEEATITKDPGRQTGSQPASQPASQEVVKGNGETKNEGSPSVKPLPQSTAVHVL